MRPPIALQLYSIRHACAEDLIGTLAKVGAMGYDGVEFAGFHGHEPQAIRTALDAAGLKAEGTHTSVDALSPENFDATVKAHHAIGAKFVIIPSLPAAMRDTPEACVQTGATLTKLVAQLAPHGLRLGFHAHHDDMLPLSGGKSAWYLIAENTPDSFIMQYDTANGMSGGADPVQPIVDFPGRGASVHLKEWKVGHGAIVGEGDVPWERVFQACEPGAGTEWYVVEYEIDEDPNPLKSVEQCLVNLRAMGK